MEVILIKDLKRKGTFGDTIEVADGYARNYLIPNGFALIANNANKKRFEEIKDKAMAQVTELRTSLQHTADQIKGKTFTMTALSRDGKLYGSITPSIIVNDMIQKELPDLKINASDVIIDAGNIKFVGTYTCKAQFTKNISSSFTIVIESDESDEQPELLEAIFEDDKKPPPTDTTDAEPSDEDEENGVEEALTDSEETQEVSDASDDDSSEEDADVTESPEADVTESPEADVTESPEADVTESPEADVTESPEADVADDAQSENEDPA